MNEKVIIDFIKSIKDINRDEYFEMFLDALEAKLNGKEFDIDGLPEGLKKEFNSFANKSLKS